MNCFITITCNSKNMPDINCGQKKPWKLPVLFALHSACSTVHVPVSAGTARKVPAVWQGSVAESSFV